MHLLVANQIARTLRLTFSLVKDIPESTLVSIGSRLVARRDRPLARRRDAARQPQQGARTQPSKNPAPVRVDHCGRFASRFWAAFAAPSAFPRSPSPLPSRFDQPTFPASRQHTKANPTHTTPRTPTPPN